jgi:hypothetical protein
MRTQSVRGEEQQQKISKKVHSDDAILDQPATRETKLIRNKIRNKIVLFGLVCPSVGLVSLCAYACLSLNLVALLCVCSCSYGEGGGGEGMGDGF